MPAMVKIPTSAGQRSDFVRTLPTQNGSANLEGERRDMTLKQGESRRRKICPTCKLFRNSRTPVRMFTARWRLRPPDPAGLAGARCGND